MLVVWLCGRAVVCSATAGWLEGRDTGGRREDEETSSHPHTPIPHPHPYRHHADTCIGDFGKWQIFGYLYILIFIFQIDIEDSRSIVGSS